MAMPKIPAMLLKVLLCGLLLCGCGGQPQQRVAAALLRFRPEGGQ